MKDQFIALIQGGLSSEHKVSRMTGQAFAEALDELGLNYKVVEASESLPKDLAELKPDLALLALHGKYGEDGTVQGICEYLKIPYTGSGVLASALCMDKYYSKQIFIQNGIPTPRFEYLKQSSVDVKTYRSRLEYPLVVKPSRDGSSVGISICQNESELGEALKAAFQIDNEILIEEFIPGKEVTVAVLNGNSLTSIEIRPKSGYYDYENKYTAGKTDYLLPAELPETVLSRCSDLALKTYQVCRVRGCARVDFRVTDNGEAFVIEINTLPGCTKTSLVPKAARHDGISFTQLVESFIKGAALDYGTNA